MTEPYFRKYSQTYSTVAGEYVNSLARQQCKRGRQSIFIKNKIKIIVDYVKNAKQKYYRYDAHHVQ